VKRLSVLSVSFLLSLLVACAHPINITPRVGSIGALSGDRIDRNVGYYISSEDMAKVVVTDGGGGDKVKYFLYKESEPALKQVLANIFRDVHAVPSLDDLAFITSKQIDYVFVPVIAAQSSSRSMWIWPPSDFTMELACRALDAAGNVVWETRVTGDAHMRLPDVARDHALAGREAAAKAFLELQQSIVSSEKFR
jgi:hypothetical protein